MKKYTLGLLLVGALIVPAGLRACDCEDDHSNIVHFKDGLSPNGPACDCGCAGGCGGADAQVYSNSYYGFRDYGPAHVVPPPAPYTPPPRPNS